MTPQRNWFLSTHWSIVLEAGRNDSPEAQAALDALCRTYWLPLYRFARRFQPRQEDAEDMTQGFFCHFIEKGYIRAADPQRGRFRAFLLTSFRHFMQGEWAKSKTTMRGGRVAFVPLEDLRDAGDKEAGLVDTAAPEVSYDRDWAAALFANALRHLRQEYANSGALDRFEALKVFLSQPSTDGAYASLARELGISPQSVAVAVHRLRQRFGELVRLEVAQTVSSEQDIEDELRQLRLRLGE